MLSLETRVNGVLISLITICNEMITEGKNNYLYDVKYRSFGKDDASFDFKVIHNRDEGAEKLLFKVYKEIDKIKRKI